MANSIEKRVREALKRHKKSVSKLAREIGVSRVALYHFFKGNYSREMLNKISSNLAIPVHVLIAPEGMETELALMERFRRSDANTQNQVLNLLTGQNQNNEQRKPLIVVLDDVLENVQLLGRILRKDYEVLEFTNAKDALSLISKRKPDLIISDQRMPEMSGTEFLCQARTQGAKDSYKMIVSAYSDVPSFLSAINDVGIDAFMVKPFKAEDLKSKVQSLVSVTIH